MPPRNEDSSRRNSINQHNGSPPPPYSPAGSPIAAAHSTPPPPQQKPVYQHDIECRPYIPYQGTDVYAHSKKEIHYYPDRTAIIVEKPIFDFENRRRRQDSNSSSDDLASCQCSTCGYPIGQRRKHRCSNRPATTYCHDSASQRRLNSWLNIGTFGCFAGLAALFGYIWSSRLDADEEVVVADEDIDR